MSEPIRVAQVLSRMDSGGIEAVVCSYYRHMDRRRVQFDFYYDEGSAMPCREELLALGAGLYPLPPCRRLFAYQRALGAAFAARRYRVAHVHMNTLSVFPLLAAWRAGVPVRICHNHTTAHRAEGVRTWIKYLLRPWSRLFATEYWACGEHAGRWMYGHRAFTVLPNAIDAEKYAWDAVARLRLRRELGIPEDAFVVGHVGRFMPQKNHAFLLEIFAQVLSLRGDAYLLLVGEGELLEPMRQRARELDVHRRVIFTGARQDADKLYSAMDVFCLPSLYEGLPVVGLEAQANGLPLLCADTVSDEICLTPSVRRLPLGDAAAWAERLAEARRGPEAALPAEYDIAQSAPRLQETYLQAYR